MTTLAAPVTASPFPGLTPFGDSDEDALLFFGREREREVIAANLLASRLTVLYGASGVGKSSVLRAGVAHHLRTMARRNLETRGHPEFAVVVFDEWTGDPADALVAAVAEELHRVFGDRAPTDRAATLTDTLHDWSGRLDCELLLILDQTEEYFLYHEHEEGPRTFAGELPDLVTRPGLPVSVLLAIRDDALSRLDRFKGQIPNLFANYLRLDHLDRRAGRAAILGPLEQYNRLHDDEAPVTIEPSLVETLLDETAAGRVHLGRRGRGVVRQPGSRSRVEAPYLQLVLQRLWDEERAAGSNVLRAGTLERLGGANEIVRTHLERALALLPVADKDVAADVFSHLVTPSGTKIAHDLHDLAEYAHVDEERLEPIVSSLVRHRILRPVARRADGLAVSATPYEIFHDVLGDAVLAWRAAHESERRVAYERADADRRHRRILRVLGAAFVALVAMAAVAAYALDKRAEARTAAARATEQALVAERALEEAQASERKAQDAAREADAARKDAVTQRDAATAAKNEADAQRAVAFGQRERAEAEEAAAVDARRTALYEKSRAESATADALEQRRDALAARADAFGQRRIAIRQRDRLRRQERLTTAALKREQASAALVTDPARTLRLSLDAAALDPRHGDGILLEGLLETRIRAVLSGGGGALTAAAFAADGRVVTTTTRGHVRVFATAPFRLLHRLTPLARATTLALSPDGRTAAVGGDNGAVALIDATTGAARPQLRHGSGHVLDVEFSPDGRLLAVAGSDAAVTVWDVASSLQISRFPHPRSVRSVRFSPDGKQIVTTPMLVDRFARVFDLERRTEVAQLGHGGVVTSAQFTPDGRFVFSTGRRNAFRWRRGTWQRSDPFVGHVSAVHGAAISPDSKRAITYDDAGVGRVWRLEDGELVTMHVRHENSIESAQFAADNVTVLTASTDLTARIWSGDQSEFRTSLVGHGEPVVLATFDAAGTSVLTASDDGTARVWASTTEPTLAALGPMRHAGGATAFDAAAARVASGGADGNVLLWRANGGLVHSFRLGARVTSVALSSDASRLLATGDDGVGRIWRTRDRGTVATIRHDAPIRAAILAADGRTAVVAGGNSARVWSRGAMRRVLEHPVAVTSVAVSRDGALVVTGAADGKLRVWRGGEAVRELDAHAGPVTAVSISPDSRRIASGGADATGRVWDVATGAAARTPEEQSDAVNSIRFSENGRRVLAAATDGQVRSWPASGSGKTVVFRGHVSNVADARFSPDGRWVVTAGPSAAGLWIAASGRRVYFLRGHGAPLVGAAFAGNGRNVVSAGADGSARVYRCDICGPPRELRALARKRLASIARVGFPR